MRIIEINNEKELKDYLDSLADVEDKKEKEVGTEEYENHLDVIIDLMFKLVKAFYPSDNFVRDADLYASDLHKDALHIKKSFVFSNLITLSEFIDDIVGLTADHAFLFGGKEKETKAVKDKSKTKKE